MGDYWICPDCGHAVEGVAPVRIPDDKVARFNELADEGMGTMAIIDKLNAEAVAERVSSA